MKAMQSAAAAALFSLFAGAAVPAAAAELPGLMTPGTLTVCISKNGYAPLYWKEGGEIKGFEVDALQAITARLGVKLQFTEVAFDGLMPGLVSRRCDLLRSGLYVSEARTKVADVIPYLKTGPALVVRKGNPEGIHAPADLSGKTVAAQAASANGQILKDLSAELQKQGKAPIKIAVYPELPETVAAVQNGRADAVIETDVAASAIAARLSGELQTIGGLFHANTRFGMYLAKGSPLAKPVDEAAQALTADGTFGRIAAKYGLPAENVVSSVTAGD